MKTLVGGAFWRFISSGGNGDGFALIHPCSLCFGDDTSSPREAAEFEGTAHGHRTMATLRVFEAGSQELCLNSPGF